MGESAGKKATCGMPQKEVGKAVIAVSVIALVLASGALGLVILAPRPIVQTSTTTTTIMPTSFGTTTAMPGASQCGFTTTCAAMSASGLELILAVNSPTVRPNDTLTVSVTELNTLPTTNNVSAASE